MKNEIIYEGQTEEKVCRKIAEILQLSDTDFTSSNGKKNLHNLTRTKLRENLLKNQPFGLLILQDLDSHDEETEEKILQSQTDLLQRFFDERQITTDPFNFERNPTHPNVHTISIPDLDFCLVLHIATKRWHQNFIKSTIDDYVLELALRPDTVEKLAESIPISPDKVIAKITQEIPDLLKANANGQDNLTEAKDYVRLYAAVLQLHTSPAVFAGKTMANAAEQDIRDVFQPLFTAFEFVGGA